MRNSLLVCIISAVLLGAGCKQPKRKVIGMVPKGTSHMFWVTVQAGALAAAKDFDVELIWNGPAQEAEVDRQIQIVDSMVARHVDALAVAASIEMHSCRPSTGRPRKTYPWPSLIPAWRPRIT